MASKQQSKIKRVLLKLKKIFKCKKRQPIEPPSKTQPVSESETVSKALETTSLATAPTAPTITLPTNIPDAAPVIPETSNLSQSKIETSLWDRAYDGLREKDRKLVEEYEQLLSIELQTSTSTKNDLQPARRDNGDERDVRIENQMESSDRRTRLSQLETITNKGLQQLEKKKTRFNMFGREFILRDQLAQATRLIQTIKDVIDDAVRASPEASIAWAGVCVILPVFMNPSAAEEASRDGCIYVTSRIRFYVKLETLLLESKRSNDSGIHVALEDRLLALYQLIIDFQIRTVRRLYLTRLKRLEEDTIRHEDWKGMMDRIKESEKLFSKDYTLIKDVPMRAALEELNGNAEKLAAHIDSMVASLIEDSRKAPMNSFQNKGSGNQFNAAGGTQYNATGKGMQFSGVTFSGAVTFGGNGG
ncbi:hypothetical protein TASIC1_0011015000 [Trichoderma asperellum]|uniref:NWD NACHT-NTPase N-terminal domain-containing protein n=1 Tax=Trichoderma asperellum TaxID=101201 RepID=A0A6V8R842_TRIAP|nr:hypothetical protein TASIC1_0011015000 [Trichoderma asperellum]